MPPKPAKAEPLRRKKSAPREVAAEEEDLPRGSSSSDGAPVPAGAAPGGRRRKRTEAGSAADEVDPTKRARHVGPRSVPPLRAEALSPGSRVLGEIVAVRRRKLVVVLPGGLRGSVAFSEASDALAAGLTHPPDEEDEDGEDDSNDEEDEFVYEDEQSARTREKDSTPPKAKASTQPLASLRDLFAPGQRVRCVVLSNPQRKYNRNLQLSLRLSRVQGSLLRDAFYPGYRVAATIRSVEDYGYVLSLGVPTVTGFLRSNAQYRSGSLLNVAVESFDSDLSVVTAVEDDGSGKQESLKEYEGLTLSQLMPGALVAASVRNVVSNGLILSFLTHLTGYVELSHLREAFPSSNWAERYEERQKVNARVLFVDSKRKRVHLSLKPHIVNATNVDFLPIGTVIEHAIVRRVDPNGGLLLELPSTSKEEDLPIMRSSVGYVHAPNVSDGHIERLERSFKEGQPLKARVIGRKPIEGASSLSLKKSIVEQRFFSLSEIVHGAVITGTLERVDSKSGAFIKISENITALCPPLHLTDSNSQRALAKLEPGKKLKVRVLEINPEERKLIVTRKRQLLRSDLPILASLEDAAPGTISHGVITGVFRYGCFVSFYNGVKGLAHANDLGLGAGQDPRESYERGQCARCTVLSASEGKGKLRLSLIGISNKALSESTPQATQDQVEVGSMLRGVAEAPPARGELNVRLENGARGVMQVVHLSDHLATANALGDSITGDEDLGQLLVINRGQRNGRECLYLTKKRLLMKDISQNKLPESISDLNEGETYEGYIANITDIGCFVRFLGNLTGLASISASNTGNVHSGTYAIGQSVQARVTSIEREKAKFYLTLDPKRMRVDKCSSELLVDMLSGKELLQRNEGHEQLSNHFAIGFKVNIVVTEEKDYGLLADLPGYDSAVGFIMHHQAHEARRNLGEQQAARVLDINKRDGILDLSLKPELIERSEFPPGDAARSNVPYDATVQLVKSEYTVVALNNDARTIAFMPTQHMNLQRFDVQNAKFSPGQHVRVQLHQGASAETGGRLVMQLLSLRPGHSGESQQQHATDPNALSGSVLEAKILDMQAREVRVSTMYGRGRIHATSMDSGHTESPLKQFEISAATEVAVLGATPRGYLELSTKEFDLRSARQGGRIARSIPSFEDLVVGDRIVGVCTARMKRSLLVELSPRGLRGAIDWMEATDDVELLNRFTKADEFNEGRALHCRVIALDHTRNKIRLSCRKRSSLKSNIRNNALIPAKIKAKERGRGLRVETIGDIEGFLHITELSDSFVDDPLKRTPPVDTVVQCRVLDESMQPVQMSMRPSLGGTGIYLGGGEGIQGQRIESLHDVQIGQIVRAYVKLTNSKGCFVTLGRNVEGRVKLMNLSKEYVQEPAEEYPSGKAVTARVIGVDTTEGRLELSIKNVHDSGTDVGVSEGNTVTGSVKRVESYGVIIAIDGLRKHGLCHKKNFSDESVRNLEAQIKEGTSVQAKVLSVDHDTGRISLGMKQSLFDGDGEFDEEDSAEANEDESVSEDGIDAEKETLAEQDRLVEDSIPATEDDLHAMVSERVGVSWEGEAASSHSTADGETTTTFDRDGEHRSAEGRSNAGCKRKRSDKIEGEKRTANLEASSLSEAKAFERERERIGSSESAEPQSAEDFEKLVLASPNASYLWIRYMAHQVSMGELDEARNVAERALETIRLTDERERENVWVSFMNLESTYGDPPVAAVHRVFELAVERANPKRMHLALVGIHERAGRLNEAEQLLKKAEKRFGYSVKVWMRHVEHILTAHKGEGAGATIQQLLSRAFQSLPRRKHVKATFRTALLEFKRGSAERGRTVFESLVRNYPKRVDIFNAYVDQEVKKGDIDRARALLERGTALSLPAKKMKAIFKKYLEVEKEHGDEESVERVKAKAFEFVERSL